MKNFDLLGRNVSLRYKGLSVYQNRFGGLATIGIFIIVALRLNSIFDNNFTRPQILFQERIVEETQQLILTSKQFQFAIGVTKDSLNYVSNQKIFTLEAHLIIKNTSFNINTNQNETTWQSQPLSLEICTKDHFIIEGVSEPKLNQMFGQLLCLPMNQKIILQEDIYSESMTYLSFQLKKCKGLVCEDSKLIDEFMKNYFVELYISDSFFSPEDKDSPYKYYGRKFNYYNSANFSKLVNINLRNNKIESDVGLFKENIESENFFSFSYTEEHILDKTDDYISNFIIRFDQKKENLYKRSYQKMILIIPEIGGLVFILYCIAFSFNSFYQNIQLNQRLIKQMFTFNEIKQGVKNQIEQQAKQNMEKSTTLPKIGILIQELSSEDKDDVGKRENYNQSQRDSLLINDHLQKDSKSVLKQGDSSPTTVFDSQNQPFSKSNNLQISNF